MKEPNTKASVFQEHLSKQPIWKVWIGGNMVEEDTTVDGSIDGREKLWIEG